MELIQYLNSNFLTKQELLDISKVTNEDFLSYQQQKLMPTYSYKLDLNITSDSFFGLHNEEQTVEYYAKGYSSWLAIIQSLKSADDVYSVFSKRYTKTIKRLQENGHSSNNPKINSELNDHIKDEWQHFLSGIYGLCTKSGLPEDIAAKEFSIIEIKELYEKIELSLKEIEKLTLAVNLLDSASSLFAPHERLQSSRHRLINEVRRKYKL